MDNDAICKRVGEIVGYKVTGMLQNGQQFGYFNGTQYFVFNPLEDDGLCFQLMVKYEVERSYEPYDFIGWSYRCSCSLYKEDNKIVLERTYFGKGEETPDISPNKAICLAIIEAHKENKP